MPLGNVAWVKEWGGQLAGLAEEIVEKVVEYRLYMRMEVVYANDIANIS